MMHGIKRGIYEGWSPYFKYDNYDNLKQSEKLPVPNKIKYTFNEDGADLSGDLIVYKTLDKNNLGLDFIVTLLDKVKNFNSIKPSEDPDINELLNIINYHNTYEYSTNSLKNYVVRNIIETSNHPKNQISSYSPIDFGKYEDIKKSKENNYILSLMDGISMDQQQETNAVGKDVIGIAANGIKDYFALVEYYSKYYTNGVNLTDNEYFERSFRLGNEIPSVVNRIAGLDLEKKSIELLDKYSGGAVSKLVNPYSDPSLVLSSLLSAATDNAKELILKAINAGKEFASMHLYLIMLGFDEGEVAKYMTSPKISKILENFKSNIFMFKDKKSPDKVINDKKIIGNDPDLMEFKQIYNLSKELTFLAKILKINQGLSASSENLYLYFKNIQKEFIDREKDFIDTYSLMLSEMLNVKSDTLKVAEKIPELVKLDKPYLQADPNYVNKVVSEAERQGILFGKFDINLYFENSEYKNAAINYYNLIKGTFNVLDVIEKLSHFNGMVLSTKMIDDQIKTLSKKYNFVQDVEKILNITSLNEDKINKSFQTFDDILIHKWFINTLGTDDRFLINLQNIFKLNNSEVKYYSEDGSLNVLKDEDLVIDFTNDLSLFNFKLVMENNIVPYLKSKYKDNDFISGLITRKKDNRSWLTTKVRMNKLNDAKNLDLLVNYQKGFDKLMDQSIKIGDTEFKILDLLFLYNVIVNKDKAGSDRLTKLFKNYISNPNSISRSFYEYQSDIDSGKIDLFTEDDPIENYTKAIEFGVLNEKGKLYEGYGNNREVIAKQNNPNFVLITSFSDVNSYAEFKDLFRSLSKYIKNNNLLIELNCE